MSLSLLSEEGGGALGADLLELRLTILADLLTALRCLYRLLVLAWLVLDWVFTSEEHLQVVLILQILNIDKKVRVKDKVRLNLRLVERETIEG